MMTQEPLRRHRFARVIPQEAVDRIKQLVLASQSIVITCHVSPDGDALGSSTALCSVLHSLGKEANVVTADCAPRSLQFLPGVREIVAATRQGDRAAMLIHSADLIFCLDFNCLKRIDRLGPLVEASKAHRVVIDHHLDPEIDADVMISDPEISSTSALLYLFLYQAGWAKRLSRGAAADIYTGMMTDTGHFTYNSNDPDLYLIIYDLMRKGIDKDNLYKLVMDTSSETRIRLMGYARFRMEIFKEHRMGLITLSRKELDEFDYTKGDTEGLVNTPLSIPEVTWSVFLREDTPDSVKVSMRSKGDFPVNKICEQHFGGGGHVNAAGGDFNGSLSDALTYLQSIIPEYDIYL
ncbi:MAG: bifunctional oligoribonuclease/PAP phosphatase NrnA [Muribaculaceae bacterium]|nr:bifunctional oligoribonuclease/PAP phosphatase NrnA [Muribaculaceae bacterium]